MASIDPIAAWNDSNHKGAQDDCSVSPKPRQPARLLYAIAIATLVIAATSLIMGIALYALMEERTGPKAPSQAQALPTPALSTTVPTTPSKKTAAEIPTTTGLDKATTTVPPSSATNATAPQFVVNSFVDSAGRWRPELNDLTSVLGSATRKYYETALLSLATEVVGKRQTDLRLDIRISVYKLSPHKAKSGDTVIQVFYRASAATTGEITVELFNVTVALDNIQAKITAFGWTPVDSIIKGWSEGISFLKSTMNESVDPCEDFYEYSCGTWIANIPPQLVSYNVFTHVRTQVTANLISALRNENLNNLTQPEAVRKGKRLFDVCRQASIDDIYKNTPMLDLLKKFGGWPIIEETWHDNNVSIEKLVATLDLNFNHGTLISSGAVIDLKNVKQFILGMYQGSLYLDSRDYYLNITLFNDTLRNYINTMRNVARVFANDSGANISSTRITNDARAMFRFEAKIAEMLTPSAEMRNDTSRYNLMSLDEIKAAWPNINWDEYYGALFSQLPKTLQLLHGGAKVLINTPAYLDQLNLLFKSTTGFTRRTKINYLLWRLVAGLGTFVDARARRALQQTRRTRSDEPQPEDLLPVSEAYCTSLVTGVMPFVSGRIFVDLYFPAEAKVAVEDMVGQLRTAFSGMLSNFSGFDEISEKYAQIKLAGMRVNSAYPDWILNNSELNAKYDTLKIGGQNQSFFELFMAINAWRSAENLERVGTPTDRNRYFSGSPATVNAYFAPSYNTITFPAAILQPPWFKYDFPKSINYGAMGTVIGHEITHGFDDHGSQYYDDGTLYTWMSDTSQKAFNNMAGCIVKEYSNFCPESLSGNICVNGKATQGENIGDNGGIREAYLAFKSYVNQNGEEPRLPGMEKFSSDQLFFLAFASTWCGRSSEKTLTNSLLTDPHSPGRYRVLGTLRNFEAFGEAFGCRKGVSKMYPADNDKCFIWSNKP